MAPPWRVSPLPSPPSPPLSGGLFERACRLRDWCRMTPRTASTSASTRPPSTRWLARRLRLGLRWPPLVPAPSSLVTAKTSNSPCRHAHDTPRCQYRIGFSTKVDAPLHRASMVAVDGRRFWMTVVRPEHRSREADATIRCLWHLQPRSACPQLRFAARCVFLFILSVFFCCHRCCSDAQAGHTSAQV